METIYHEKQEGQLCAQHCLNNLLQESHFTAVDLGKIAEQLDQEEAATLAEGGLGSPALASFVEQPSPNMDDSGYFSGQVINRALSVWSLTMALWNAPHMKHVMDNPTAQKAFICNHDSHWLTIRKLGRQWFNLNSLLPRPELISDTYLNLFLTQLQMEGYSIFVIEGHLPACEADQLLTLVPVEPPAAGRQQRERGGEQRTLIPEETYDADLAAAMSASLTDGQGKFQPPVDEQYDVDLAAAISMSMQDSSTSTESEPSTLTQPSRHSDRPTSDQPVSEERELTAEELRSKRLKHLGQP